MRRGNNKTSGNSIRTVRSKPRPFPQIHWSSTDNLYRQHNYIRSGGSLKVESWKVLIRYANGLYENREAVEYDSCGVAQRNERAPTQRTSDTEFSRAKSDQDVDRSAEDAVARKDSRWR